MCSRYAYGKFCCHLGNFWFTSTGIIEGSSRVLVPPLIPIWPTSKLGEVVQGLVPLGFETPGWRYHRFPGQHFPVLDHQPSWWKFLPCFETEFPLLHLWPLSLVLLFCLSAKSLALSFSVPHHAVRQREELLLPPKIANEGIRTEPIYSWWLPGDWKAVWISVCESFLLQKQKEFRKVNTLTLALPGQEFEFSSFTLTLKRPRCWKGMMGEERVKQPGILTEIRLLFWPIHSFLLIFYFHKSWRENLLRITFSAPKETGAHLAGDFTGALLQKWRAVTELRQEGFHFLPISPLCWPVELHFLNPENVENCSCESSDKSLKNRARKIRKGSFNLFSSLKAGCTTLSSLTTTCLTCS